MIGAKDQKSVKIWGECISALAAAKEYFDDEKYVAALGELVAFQAKHPDFDVEFMTGEVRGREINYLEPFENLIKALRALIKPEKSQDPEDIKIVARQLFADCIHLFGSKPK